VLTPACTGSGGIGGDAFTFRYHVVPLWQLDARRMRAQLGLQGAPFCAAMRGADEAFVRTLADEVRTDRHLTKPDRRSTMQLLYVVTAAILGSDTPGGSFTWNRSCKTRTFRS
jgi:hypothetical protein